MAGKSSMAGPSVSMVVPTLNEEKYLGTLLRSLKHQLKRGDELIIVDSYSSDNTVKIAKKYTKKILFMPRLGIGPAKTFGARRAKNAIVAFLDADSGIADTWLERLRAAFAGGADVYDTFSVHMSRSPVKQALYKLLAVVMYASCDILYTTTGCRWILSNSSAFRKSLLMRVGGYRQVICEDWDIAIRLRKYGAKHEINYVRDYGSTVRVSDRRFKKNGMVRTIFMWTVEAVKLVLFGRATASGEYGVAR